MGPAAAGLISHEPADIEDRLSPEEKVKYIRK